MCSPAIIWKILFKLACFLFFPFCITLKGHISWPNSCGERISSFAEILLQPKPDLLKVVEKGAFAPQVGNFLSLHNAYSLKWNSVGYIGIVVHAVSHHLALRWQGKVLKELVSSCTSLFLAFVFLNFEWRGGDSRRSPAIWWVSFIDVDQQKVSHTRELLHQLAEGWQLACERGSGSWAKVDDQWPLWVGKIQKVAFGSTLATNVLPAATAVITALGYVDYTGVWGFTSQFDLLVGIQEEAVPDAAQPLRGQHPPPLTAPRLGAAQEQNHVLQENHGVIEREKEAIGEKHRQDLKRDQQIHT